MLSGPGRRDLAPPKPHPRESGGPRAGHLHHFLLGLCRLSQRALGSIPPAYADRTPRPSPLQTSKASVVFLNSSRKTTWDCTTRRCKLQAFSQSNKSFKDGHRKRTPPIQSSTRSISFFLFFYLKYSCQWVPGAWPRLPSSSSKVPRPACHWFLQ